MLADSEISLGIDWKWMRIQYTANGMFSPIIGRMNPIRVLSNPMLCIW